MAEDVKRIVCLANSYKQGGSCIAGREVLPDGRLGRWIRPVSARETDEVSPTECRYEGGGYPSVLDVVDVPVLRHQPKDHQQENWLINAEYYWERINRFAPSDLEGLIHPASPLWLDGFKSYNGVSDRIPFEYAKDLKDSLRLIRVSSLEISEEQSMSNNALRLRGHFEYAGRKYALRITDPEYADKYFRQIAPRNPSSEILMTVSLGSQFYGFAYKLIAAIIEP